MAKGHAIELATRVCGTKAEANKHFSDMLGRYRPGDRVSEEDGLDLGMILLRHHEYAEKVGCGVSHFEVMKTDWSQCFRVVRVDGTGTDFSFKYCVSGRPPTQRTDVTRAFREVVGFALRDAKSRIFREHGDADGRVPCAVSGDLISIEDAHLDHLPPMTFEVLLHTFMAARGLSDEDIRIAPSRDDQTAYELADGDLAKDFYAYHAQTAKLDVVRKDINLRQAPQHRIRHGRGRITAKAA